MLGDGVLEERVLGGRVLGDGELGEGVLGAPTQSAPQQHRCVGWKWPGLQCLRTCDSGNQAFC